MAEKEIWRDVTGFEGRYQISNFGRVKAMPFWHNNRFGGYMTSERIIKARADKKNYLHVALAKDGLIKEFKVHRLVALHFVPNPRNYPQINHKDENKANNHVENLEWCSNIYNANYGGRTDRILKSRNQERRIVRERRKEKAVIQYSLDGNVIRQWKSAKEVKNELGIDNGDIGKCCRGQKLTAGGYKWKYAESE